MGQTTVSIRMDEDVKRQLDEFCSEVGMNMSVAINMFAKTVIRERLIPFYIVLGDTSSNLKESTKKVRKTKDK